MSKTKLALKVATDLKVLAESIETLVRAMEGQTEPMADAQKEQAASNPKNKEKDAEVKTVETANISSEEKHPPEKPSTLEEVRALMAEKNREGHREAVKGILHKYGANKLTALGPEHFSQVLMETGEIK